MHHLPTLYEISLREWYLNAALSRNQLYHICNKKKILINLRNFLQILFPVETSPKVNLNNTSNIHSISISNYHLSKKHLTGILQQILWYNCHNQRWIFVKVLQILYKVAESELEQLYQKLTSSLTFFCKFSVLSYFKISRMAIVSWVLIPGKLPMLLKKVLCYLWINLQTSFTQPIKISNWQKFLKCTKYLNLLIYKKKGALQNRKKKFENTSQGEGWVSHRYFSRILFNDFLYFLSNFPL